MKKVTEEEYIGIKKWRDDEGIKSQSENYAVEIFYHCPKCNKTYSLEELSNGRK